ncbi:YIP1 family protein [Lentibacter sp.]|uniref:YIP1 family protein n=1 Tax=Lentibacter sp. TaxID=2024994 RepID=UPI003F69C51D
MVIKELVMRTLTQPAGAAGELMALGLKRDVLWLGLVLAAVLNALFFSVSFHAAPPIPLEGISAEEEAQMAFMLGLLGSPVRVAIVLGLSLVMSVFAFFFAGKFLGGQGRLQDILAVVTWWQFVGLGMSGVIMAIGVLSVALAAMLSFVGNVWLLFALIGLLTGAHRFETMFKGIGTVALSLFLMAVGLMIILTLIGFGLPPLEASNV